MSTLTIVGLKCVIGSTTVLLSVVLFVLLHLARDINQLYAESMNEMSEFKNYANAAWSEMMSIRRQDDFDSIFNRHKRHNTVANIRSGQNAYRTSASAPKTPPRAQTPYATAKVGNKYKVAQAPPTNQCNCERPNNCPIGEPGPPGENGIDGVDGEAGVPGKPGISANSHLNDYGIGNCIQCPAGEIGLPGEQGPVGNPGTVGLPGPRGANGKMGNQGERGPPGDFGPIGISGPPGEPGPIGDPGTRSTPIPGPKGPMGAVGPVGSIGEQGNDAAPGIEGPVGVMGPIGERGVSGKVGPMGEVGIPGAPGRDATYCPVR
ncbi:hypothetical protein M3Y94_00886400 [Aphelenchoides besseyi]|nr:hypothetical protein M3Y94_00886400 [Aphelenchoides besseyi]